jgi:hypothetical protein
MISWPASTQRIQAPSPYKLSCAWKMSWCSTSWYLRVSALESLNPNLEATPNNFLFLPTQIYSLFSFRGVLWKSLWLLSVEHSLRPILPLLRKLSVVFTSSYIEYLLVTCNHLSLRHQKIPRLLVSHVLWWRLRVCETKPWMWSTDMQMSSLSHHPAIKGWYHLFITQRL